MSKPIETVQQIYAAYGRGDMQFILDHLDDDVTWGIDSVAGEVPQYGIRHGKQGVAEFFAVISANAEFHSFVPSDFVGAGDHVFNHLAYELTARSTGSRVKMVSQQHWTFKNGKVIRWRGYEDTAAVATAYRKSAS